MFSKFGGFTVPSARQIYRFQQLQSSIRCFAIDRRRDGHDKPGRSRKNSIRERIRGNSSSSPSRREQEESNITGMKNILEKIDEGLDVPLKVPALNSESTVDPTQAATIVILQHGIHLR